VRLKAAIAVPLALCAALCAVPALAGQVLGSGHGSTFVVARKTIVTGREATIEARCPTGTHVWGGGFQGDTMKVTAASSRPYDGPDPDKAPDDGWLAHLQAAAPDQGQVFAICRKDDVTYAKRRVPVFKQKGIAVTLSARCPAGTHAISGGGGLKGNAIGSSAPFDSRDHDSVADDGWRIRMIALRGIGSVKSVPAWAVCADRPARHATNAIRVGPGEESDVESKCGDGRHLVGLGSRAAGALRPVGLAQIAPVPRVSRAPDRAAVSRLRNRSDETRRLVTIAICR